MLEKSKKVTITTISEEERIAYGYYYEDMLPLEKEEALRIYVLDIFPVYLLYEDDTEAMADTRSDILAHNGIFGIERADTAVYECIVKKCSIA